MIGLDRSSVDTAMTRSNRDIDAAYAWVLFFIVELLSLTDVKTRVQVSCAVIAAQHHERRALGRNRTLLQQTSDHHHYIQKVKLTMVIAMIYFS
mmetsp:Transcript_31607/g.46038  ORF Transcript_31607/g.46038 Transcript_31607/m.46038 type:complete len:94 (-) Transcript_31607:3364-3645(-)